MHLQSKKKAEKLCVKPKQVIKHNIIYHANKQVVEHKHRPDYHFASKIIDKCFNLAKTFSAQWPLSSGAELEKFL